MDNYEAAKAYYLLTEEIGYDNNVVFKMVECQIKYSNRLSLSAADYYDDVRNNTG
jgi:hypothetical protein